MTAGVNLVYRRARSDAGPCYFLVSVCANDPWLRRRLRAKGSVDRQCSLTYS